MFNKILYISLIFLAGAFLLYRTCCQDELHGQLDPKDKKLIVFDFDGTLCDSLGVVINEYNKLSKRYVVKPVTDLNEIRNTSMQKFLMSSGVSKWKLPLIRYFLVKAMKKHVGKMQSFKGMPEVLRELKKRGYQLGVLTTNSCENVEIFLGKDNLSELFDFIYCVSSIF